MATTTSQVKTVLDALASRLSSRAGLAGVRIFTFVPPPSTQVEVGSYVTLAIRITGRQEFPYAARTLKRDEFRIDGEIIVLQPGAGDDAAAAAMTRPMGLAVASSFIGPATGMKLEADRKSTRLNSSH